jgi:hypothetical protein
VTSLRAVEIYRDAHAHGGRRVIAIESVASGHSKSNNGCHLYGYLAPLAVLVCAADGIQVLDVGAEKTDLATLRQEIPELDKYLEL